MARAKIPAAPAQVYHGEYAPTTQVVNVQVGDSSKPRFSPLLAAFLSFLIPGLGQLYKGQPINGIVWFIFVVVGYILFFIPGIVLHLCCIIGAASGSR